MKKTLLSITCTLLALLTALSGCSCAPTSPLVFNDAFAGETTNLSNYREELTFDVTYKDSYATIKKDDSIKDSALPTYSNGSSTMVLQSVTAIPSFITTDLDFNGIIWSLTTSMNIDVTFGDKTFNDQTLSKVYFHSSGHSFTPIYSDVTHKNSYVFLSESSTTVRQYLYKSVTTYRKTDFTLDKYEYTGEDVTSLDVSTVAVENLVKRNDSVVKGYSPKQAIDNAELLFAMRNISVKLENTYSLPTISPAYGEPKTLSIRNASETNKKVTFNYNGTDYSIDMPVKNLAFAIGGTDNTGSEQHLSVQIAKTEQFAFNNALPIEYVETLY
jgi:hypothetical protein